MKKFAAKLALFGLLNALIASGAYFVVIRTKEEVPPGRTSGAILHRIPEGKALDLVVLGSSHASIFGSIPIGGYAQALLEAPGGGIVPLSMYLRHFYRRGNGAKVVLHLIDPCGYYSRRFNEESHFLRSEPFRFSFLLQAFSFGVASNSIKHYVWNQQRRDWLASAGTPPEDGPAARGKTSREARTAVLFPRGADEKAFRRYWALLRKTVRLAEKEGSRYLFVVPPTLLSPMPGEDRFLVALKALGRSEGVPVLDFSRAVPDPDQYNDWDHLTRKAADDFQREYLTPAVRKRMEEAVP
jgi:hypothetical protein